MAYKCLPFLPSSALAGEHGDLRQARGAQVRARDGTHSWGGRETWVVFRATPILGLEVFPSCYYPLSLSFRSWFLWPQQLYIWGLVDFTPPHPALGEGKVFFSSVCFYWSLVDFQECVSFRCTAEWFSYIYIYMCVFFFRFFSLIDYYKILSRVLCAI